MTAIVVLVLVIALAVSLGTRRLGKPRTRAEWEWQQEQRKTTRANNRAFALFIAMLIGGFVVLGLMIKVAAGAEPKSKDQLIALWAKAYDVCHSTDSVEIADAVCAVEDKTVRQLNARGWCFGRKSDPSMAARKWHRCGADSYRLTVIKR